MFKKIKAVLIDLSGTIHIESNEIPGSIEALERLKNSGLKYKFVTNTTKESQNALYTRLRAIGFDLKREQIFSSLIAARDFIEKENLRPHLIVEKEALEDFQTILENNDAEAQGSSNKQEAVFVGLAPSLFNYDSMNVAFHKLLSGARLVAIHQGRYYKTSNGNLSIGPGPFVRLLAYAAELTDDQITVVGKPSKEFFERALKSLDPNLTTNQVVMIGDDVRDDVGGAQDIGIDGILVQTGKYRKGDELKINPEPKLVVPRFADAINRILDDQQQC